jgi:hypothetical protein
MHFYNLVYIYTLWYNRYFVRYSSNTLKLIEQWSHAKLDSLHDVFDDLARNGHLSSAKSQMGNLLVPGSSYLVPGSKVIFGSAATTNNKQHFSSDLSGDNGHISTHFLIAPPGQIY